jgi:hypothetical protein
MPLFGAQGLQIHGWLEIGRDNKGISGTDCRNSNSVRADLAHYFQCCMRAQNLISAALAVISETGGS